MATRIEITNGNTTTTVRVTDDGGRDQTRVVKRYPDPESASYIRFVDALDAFMGEPEMLAQLAAMRAANPIV
jgi:hypothetical protein